MPLEIYPPGLDFVGGDGYDDDDDVNALLSAAAGDGWAAGARAKARPRSHAVQQRMQQRSALVRQQEPNRYREFPLGFDSGATLIAATGTSTITSRPQVAFKGKRLSVSRTIAPSFTITDIKVGNVSQLPTTDAIPAEAFSDDSVGMNLDLDTCQLAMNISISVENIASASARFRAALIGHAVM